MMKQKLIILFWLSAMLATAVSVNADVPAESAKQLTYIEAVKLNDLERTELLLSTGTEVDDRQGGHYSALFFASAKGYTDMVRLLLDVGANVNALGRGNWSPLMAAALHGHSEVIELLMAAKANSSLRNLDGMTALLIAASQDQLAAVAALLTAGVDVNARTRPQANVSKNALVYAAQRNNLAMVQQLIAAGIKLDERAIGRPALFYAAENNALEIIDLMIAKGASINVRDSHGNTALHFAVARLQPATVQHLLNKKIAWASKNKQGQTALDLAALAGRTDNMLLLYDLATASQRDNAFLVSVKSGVLTSVSALLEKGADPNLHDGESRTALLVASRNRHVQIIEVLLANGADINALDKQGNDALLSAVAQLPVNKKSIALLLEHGAKADKKNSLGQTAISRIELLQAKPTLSVEQRKELDAILKLLRA